MAYSPRLNAIAKITVKDINNNSVLKTFSAVRYMNIDYNDATINIVDTTGSFTFPFNTITSFTYTITTGVNGVHTVVMS